jgi:TRAP-type C4-dicarboxylate transport system permease small subunit
MLNALNNAIAQVWFGIQVPGVGSSLTTPDGLVTKVLEVINLFVGLASVVCVVMIIYGGLQYITAAGDAEKVESGSKTLTNAIIGLVIIFISVVIVNFVANAVVNGF